LNKLLDKQNNGLIKVITGIRRCGKSYLLFNLFRNALLASGVKENHIIGMGFDGYDNKKYRDPAVFYPYINELVKDSQKYYILLDEVQLLVDFEEVLNALLHLPNVDVYVTGSNAKFLSKDIITEFRGRGDEVHLSPLSFAEFMSIQNCDPMTGWREYCTYGGLPTVVLQKNAENKTEELGKLFRETYIADILGRHSLRHKEELQELMRVLASGIGSYTNSQKLVNTFKSVKGVKITKVTIEKYLEYFTDAFLVSPVQRYDIKGKRYINSLYKYYFSDVGLRNYCINFRQQEENHSMENILYNELCIRGFNVDVGMVEYNYKDENGQSVRKQLEIDFVLNKGNKRIYLQSAWTLPDADKTAQEQRPFLLVKDSFAKVIVTKDNVEPWVTEQGVTVVNIWDLLLKGIGLD